MASMKESPVQYNVVPDATVGSIKVPARAEWFQALLDEKMISTSTRPTLTKSMTDTLLAQGLRLRTRRIDDLTYLWLEAIPAPDQDAAMPDPEQA